jgi:hypothetical protein
MHKFFAKYRSVPKRKRSPEKNWKRSATGFKREKNFRRWRFFIHRIPKAPNKVESWDL